MRTLSHLLVGVAFLASGGAAWSDDVELELVRELDYFYSPPQHVLLIVRDGAVVSGVGTFSILNAGEPVRINEETARQLNQINLESGTASRGHVETSFGRVQRSDVMTLSEAAVYATEQLRQKPSAVAFRLRSAAYLLNGHSQSGLNAAENSLGLEMSPEGLFWRAMGLTRLEQYEQALETLDMLLAQRQTANAYDLRAMVYMLLGNYAAAIDDYQQVLRLQPNMYSSQNNLALAYWRAGNPERAKQELDLSERFAPNQWRVYRNRLLIARAEQDSLGLISCISKLIEMSVRDPDLYFERALVWTSLKRHEQAIRDLTSVLELRPNDTKALSLRVMNHMVYARYDAALEDAQTIAGLDPEFKNVYSMFAVIYWQQKKYDLALEYIDRAIQLEPESSRHYETGAAICVEMNEVDRLIDYVTGWIQVDAKPSGERYLDRAFAYSLKGDQEAAARDLSRVNAAAAHHPMYFPVHMLLYMHAGDVAAARQCLQDFPRSTMTAGPYAAKATFYAACPDAAHRDGDVALAAANVAHQNQGDKPRWYVADALAMAHAELGDFLQAAEWGRVAIEQAPESCRGPLRARLEGYQGGKPYRIEVQSLEVPAWPREMPAHAADAEAAEDDGLRLANPAKLHVGR